MRGSDPVCKEWSCYSSTRRRLPAGAQSKVVFARTSQILSDARRIATFMNPGGLVRQVTSDVRVAKAFGQSNDTRERNDLGARSRPAFRFSEAAGPGRSAARCDRSHQDAAGLAFLVGCAGAAGPVQAVGGRPTTDALVSWAPLPRRNAGRRVRLSRSLTNLVGVLAFRAGEGRTCVAQRCGR
jgi:hypothetical protein